MKTKDELASLLYEELENSYEIAIRELRYRPSFFMSSLRDSGAIETSISHIFKGIEASGLRRLHREGRLDLSVEAIVLGGPWKKLFSDVVLKKARKTLSDLEHNYVEYNDEEDVHTEQLDSLTGGTPDGKTEPDRQQVSTARYERNGEVVDWVIENAGGTCECCGSIGPFLNRNELPYLVVHHVIFLSSGGEDTIENAVAVCPNCHAAFHHAVDAERRTELIYNRVPRLKR